MLLYFKRPSPSSFRLMTKFDLKHFCLLVMFLSHVHEGMYEYVAVYGLSEYSTEGRASAILLQLPRAGSLTQPAASGFSVRLSVRKPHYRHAHNDFTCLLESSAMKQEFLCADSVSLTLIFQL